MSRPTCRRCRNRRNCAYLRRQSRRRRLETVSRTRTAARRRLSASALRSHLESGLEAAGGWHALTAALGPSDTAALLARLAEVAAEEERAAAEADSRAQPDLSDPALHRQLCQMAIEHLAEHPDALAPHLPAILQRAPRLLTEELVRMPSVRCRLTQLGWTDDARPPRYARRVHTSERTAGLLAAIPWTVLPEGDRETAAQVIRDTNGNVSAAARAIGVPHSTLRLHLRRAKSAMADAEEAFRDAGNH